ncbi:transporter substrate-binding domain-containing protein [Endozoicomonas sp. SM1973]|uniref:Transporter substrate-binding domain-containing protein n=1 Tax=Spartinivicinus marinus TaxID=2994442 RepID=A0A853IP17_9GAMM|nr:transporter substrate-binding domain-containing protein [Spartinivicinus marinus]MCX4030241.1 transporter substrate-binding domain-containing protein [Spartinivicinus marinus]MCX4030525.1 transporter substrate-binding domain-containing protein [Spartinivicinus marinus]NYZ69616.1 transporter substrate-binding domain-containing protein [Spartinivicinus marinus]
MASSANMLTFAVAKWPPYFDDERPDQGTLAMQLTLQFREAGIDVHYHWYDSWKAAYNHAQAANVKASPGWICNQTRAKQFYFSYPIYAIKTVFFHLKTTPVQWETLADLKDIGPIAITASYYFGRQFEEAAKTHQLQLRQVRIERLTFNLLLKERVALVPMPLDNGLLILNKYFSEADRRKITYHEKNTDKSYLHIMVPKQQPGALRLYLRINQVLINSAKKLMDKKGRLLQFAKLCPGIQQPGWAFSP